MILSSLNIFNYFTTIVCEVFCLRDFFITKINDIHSFKLIEYIDTM